LNFQFKEIKHNSSRKNLQHRKKTVYLFQRKGSQNFKVKKYKKYYFLSQPELVNTFQKIVRTFRLNLEGRITQRRRKLARKLKTRKKKTRKKKKRKKKF
jgi:hypothetical protein